MHKNKKTSTKDCKQYCYENSRMVHLTLCLMYIFILFMIIIGFKIYHSPSSNYDYNNNTIIKNNNNSTEFKVCIEIKFSNF